MQQGLEDDAEVGRFLSTISTRELAEVLACREDLEEACVRPDGMLDAAIWPLRPRLGAVACVDGVAVRLNEVTNEIEGGTIRRKTGKFPNKLAYIGGVVGKFESAEAALRRHWRTDLGFEIEIPLGWEYPVMLRQYAPQIDGKNREQFSWDPGKHSFAPLYLVKITSDPRNITFGSTEYGGQEASGFEWYTAGTCPPDSEWSYNQRQGFLQVLEAADNHSAELFGGTQ